MDSSTASSLFDLMTHLSEVLESRRNTNRNRSWSSNWGGGDPSRRAAVLRAVAHRSRLIHDSRLVGIVVHVESRRRGLTRASVPPRRNWVRGDRVSTRLGHGVGLAVRTWEPGRKYSETIIRGFNSIQLHLYSSKSQHSYDSIN